MTIALTSDSIREHRTAGLGAWLPAPFFLMTGSAGYITVTIGPPDPAQLSAHPYIYIRAACAHTSARSRENFAFLKTNLDQVQTLHAVAKGENRATFGANEILARDRTILNAFWRGVVFLQGAWPFGLVETVWSIVALRRWWLAAGQSE